MGSRYKGTMKRTTMETCSHCDTTQEAIGHLISEHPMPVDAAGRVVIKGVIVWGASPSHCPGAHRRSKDQADKELQKAREKRGNDAKAYQEEALVALDAFMGNQGLPRAQWTQLDVMATIGGLIRHALTLYRLQHTKKVSRKMLYVGGVGVTPGHESSYADRTDITERTFETEERCSVNNIWRPHYRDDNKRDIYCTFCGVLIQTVRSTRSFLHANLIDFATIVPDAGVPQQKMFEAVNERLNRGGSFAQRDYRTTSVAEQIADHAIPCGLQYLGGMHESKPPGYRCLPDNPDQEALF